MALAPVGHPARPLELAIRSTRALGVLLTGFGGLITVVAFGLRWRRPDLGMIIPAALILSPGVLYLTVAAFLRRRHIWAVIAGAVVTGLYIAGALFLAGVIVFGRRGLDFTDAAVLGPLFFIGLVVAALGQLLYHLLQAGRSLHYLAAFEGRRGFEPVGVHPIGAAPPGTFPQGAGEPKPILQIPPTRRADNDDK
ncbi:MAG: hypothetical protein ACAI43_20055 [Phycisphaerae bacterium]